MTANQLVFGVIIGNVAVVFLSLLYVVVINMVKIPRIELPRPQPPEWWTVYRLRKQLRRKR